MNDWKFLFVMVIGFGMFFLFAVRGLFRAGPPDRHNDARR